MKKLLSFIAIFFAICAIQAQTSITDDFESYTDFTINPTGQWSFLDLDSDSTYGINGVSFPGTYSEMAFIVFNPGQTTPALTTMTAHSGNKLLACFASTTSPNNDWIISPDLGTHGGAVFSFWASTFSASYPERMKVGYSMTTDDPSAFTFIQGGNYTVVPAAWTNYTYIIPANAKYVAINCVSDDAFAFMLDDISIEFPTDPRIYLSTDNMDFGNTIVGDDKIKSMNIATINITEDITATTSAPFELSTDGTTYSTTATVNASGGSLYVKYSPTTATSSTDYISLSNSEISDSILLTGNAVECNPITEFPYVCGFEASEETTLCWQFLDVNADGNDGLGEFFLTGFGEGNTAAAYIHPTDTVTTPVPNDWLVSPEFEVSSPVYATFEYSVGYELIWGIIPYPFPETFSVWVIPAGGDISNAINVMPSTTVDNYIPESAFVNLAGYVDSTIRIAIKIETRTADGYYFVVDNFEVKPTVPFIEVLTETDVNLGTLRVGNSATATASLRMLSVSDPITVTANGDFKVSLDGNTFSSSISIPGDTEFTYVKDFVIQFAPTSAGNKTGTVTISSVGVSDTYDISVAGTGIECNVIASYPYATDFSSDSPCWTIKDDNGDGKTFAFGANFAAYTYSSTNSANDWLISPEFTINDEELTVQVGYSCASSNYPEKFSVWVITDLNNHTSGTKIIETINVASSEVIYTDFVSLQAYHGQNVHIGIKAESEADMYNLYIDAFSIQKGVSVNDIPTVENTINIFPNPASTTLNINSSSNIEQVEIFNLSGQMIAKEQGNGTAIQLNIADLAQGFYFVRVYSENGIVTKKVSVIK